MTGRAIGGGLEKASRALSVVGEINNQVYDAERRDRTGDIPGLRTHCINILSLDEFRDLSEDCHGHRVVAVGTGAARARAIQVAAKARRFYLLITGRDTAELLPQ
jgi:DNA-binding transcriptional regulator LsrR (DeoR family)